MTLSKTASQTSDINDLASPKGPQSGSIAGIHRDFCRWLERQEKRGDLPLSFASPAYGVKCALWMCANNPPTESLIRYLAQNVEGLEATLASTTRG